MKSIRARAVFVFLALIAPSGPGVRQALARDGQAAEAMGILGDPARPFEERLQAGQLLAGLGPEAKAVEPLLVQALVSKTVFVVDPADPFLKQVAAGEADPALASLLLRGLAARALSSFVPEKGSIPKLISLLQDENPLVRQGAAYALGSLAAEARSAVPALVDALRGDDSDNADVATFLLARIAPDRAVEPAVPLLLATVRRGRAWEPGFNAAVALRKLGRSDDELFAVLRDEVSYGRMLLLLEDAQPLNRLHVCEALSLSGPPRRDFLDLLRKAAQDPDDRVRNTAIEALRKVGAAERGTVPDPAPRALSTLPPELAEPARALIEWQEALATGDIDTFRKHLTREGRKEFDRDPALNFSAWQSDSLIGLRLLGGTRHGDTATIDFFRWDGTRTSHGSVTLIREGGRWVHEGTSDYPVSSEPGIDDSTPIGLSETAALALLKAVAAAQTHHWYKAGTYADSLAKLELPERTPGYAITLTAGATSNGIHHAWSAEAHPEGYEETGVHSYYTDERGIVLQSDTRGLPLALEMPER